MKNLLKKWLGIKAIESKIHNLNGDVLTIQEKQLAFQGVNPHQDMQAIAIEGGFTMMNLGNHEWICINCGGNSIQHCKAAKPFSMN